jgi:hypothetical protein
MERPPSHITDSQGEAQMRGIFEPEPLGWVVNKIVSDYGVDFDVQIFRDHQATGEWFKVQLKSSDSTSYSANGDFISEPLEHKHAAHYSTEIRDPIFLMHADVRGGRTFWHAPQLAPPVDEGDPRATITVRVDTRNELPATLPEMLAVLRRIQIKLGAKAVCESDLSDFAKIIDHNNQAELIRRFQDKVDFIKLQEIHALATAEGKEAEARDKVERLIENSDSSVETRFSAVLEKERMDFIAGHRDSAPQSTMAEIVLRTTERLRRLTKEGPPALKFNALIARKAAELNVLTFRDFCLYMNWLGHAREGSPAIAVQLAVERLQNMTRIIKKYNQCVRLARLASNSTHRWAVPTALLRVVQSIGPLILRLRMEGQMDAAKSYTASAMQLCRLAAWIAELNRDDDVLSAVTTTVLLLSEKTNTDEKHDDAVDFARETLAKIRDRDQAQETRAALERGIRRLAGERVEGDPEPDLVKQIIENRATGLGIDMTDPDDPMGQLIQIGIRDANPERVLRHCEHTFVTISGAAPLVYHLSQVLQLPSILGKWIHCDLHDFAVEAGTLDTAFEVFKKMYCDGCNDISARPADWNYTDEWQKRENKEHVDFMEKFYRKHSR